MKHLALSAAIVAAITCAVVAGEIVVSGRVLIPGTAVWSRGYVRGLGAYAMSLAWLALGAAAIFAGFMRALPERYARHQRFRDLALVVFGGLFVAAVIAFIIQEAGTGAP